MITTLTLAQLKRAHACQEYLDQFKQAFGQKVKITVDLAIEQASAWNWDWAAKYLLTPENLAEYQRLTDPAWANYERITAPSLADYQQLKVQAWAALYIAQGGKR